MNIMKSSLYKLLRNIVLLGGGIMLTGGILFVPSAGYHMDTAAARIRGWISPAGDLPGVKASEKLNEESLWLPDLLSVTVEPVGQFSQVVESESNPLPDVIRLPTPLFDPKKDYQDWNNCGPATLALMLRHWGWQGDQYDISQVIKPKDSDKNVNAEELARYVEQEVKDLQAVIRIGGDLTRLKQLLAAGFPVIVEKSFLMEKPVWMGDDQWAGHYLLLTGYDDREEVYFVQDSFYGPDQSIPYHDLEQDWRAFNRLYLVVYPQERLEEVKSAFGSDWSQSENLANTLSDLREELRVNDGDPFLWFDLGTTHVLKGEFSEAVDAFTRARQLGLPQRMLRYQFGPFAAAYETGDQSDLRVLVNYALKITPDSEEALYWKGKAHTMTTKKTNQETLSNKGPLQIP